MKGNGAGETLTMVIWHQASDTPRFPFHVSGGKNVNLQFGTWPIEEGQRTWIDIQVVYREGAEEMGHIHRTRNFNHDANGSRISSRDEVT